jgi:hypothetical protein
MLVGSTAQRFKLDRTGQRANRVWFAWGTSLTTRSGSNALVATCVAATLCSDDALAQALSSAKRNVSSAEFRSPGPKSRNGGSCRGVQILENLAGATGLEPAASGVTGRRSNRLSYAPAALRQLRPPPMQVKARAPRHGGKSSRGRLQTLVPPPLRRRRSQEIPSFPLPTTKKPRICAINRWSDRPRIVYSTHVHSGMSHIALKEEVSRWPKHQPRESRQPSR